MIIFVALILLNLSLIPVGITLIWLAVRSRVDELSCNICGYDLRGSVGSCKQCPECGTPLDDPQMAGRKRIVHRPPSSLRPEVGNSFVDIKAKCALPLISATDKYF